MDIPLSTADEPNRACIQLYHHADNQVTLPFSQQLQQRVRRNDFHPAKLAQWQQVLLIT